MSHVFDFLPLPLSSQVPAMRIVAKKISLIKNLIHLINDILWCMGFKNDTQAKKVILIIHNIVRYTYSIN